MRYDEADPSVSHMSFKHIVFEAEEDGIAVITINRPHKLNAIDRETMTELSEAFEQVGDAPGLKALIVTGAGEKAFVAGADIGELAAATAIELERLARRGQAVFGLLDNIAKPSVAAINGFALGAGLELAMACTLRIASPNAKLGLPEVKLGLLPGYGGTQRLPRLVGQGKTLELLLTGEPVEAREAWRIGLVNEVVEAAELLARSRAMLMKIVSNGPVAVGLAMRAVDAGLSGSLQEGLRFEAACFGVAASSEDRMEGTRAFLEKRKAVFHGR